MNYATAYPRFWFWYFWISCILLAISFADSTIDAVSGKGPATGVIGIALSAAAMWPLHGYIKQIRINPRWLWRVILVLAGLAVAVPALMLMFVAAKTSNLWIGLIPVAILLLFAPQLFALFQYIHRSEHIWVKE
jgi:hypothetical protein